MVRETTIGHFLYSTNTFLKYLLQQKYQGDKHYVWCSEHCDTTKLAARTFAAQLAPSADPAVVYKELKRDIAGKDLHSAKVNQQRASLTNRAVEWEKAGVVTADERDDILYMIEKADFDYFRPLLYVIPKSVIAPTRLQLVPMAKRAGFGEEYVITDLDGSEFDVVEL